MSFLSFGLHADLLRAVTDLRFTQPTPIQKESIPPGLSGRDVLACASTGSGKTAAFGLPILQRFMERPRGATRALILSPTRELASQIQEHLAALARHTTIRSAAIYGGAGMGPQRRAFEQGVDILVATPGRLLDHLQYPYARLDRVEVLVLDEADRMLDMGFLPDIRRILSRVPKQRQTFFFSATLPPEIDKLAREFLQQPAVLKPPSQPQPAGGITHQIYPVPHAHKSPLLLKLLQGELVKSALVFTRTKRRADRVADFLKRKGVSAARIHGDRSQAQREQALEGFKRGHYQVLVATDVAARGIDVHALSHVINFDMPGSTDDYIHRVGRTARAQATGHAFTLVTPEDESELRALEQRLTHKLPRVLLDGFDYSAVEPGPAYAGPNARSGARFSPSRPQARRSFSRPGHAHSRRRDRAPREGSARVWEHRGR